MRCAIKFSKFDSTNECAPFRAKVTGSFENKQHATRVATNIAVKHFSKNKGTSRSALIYGVCLRAYRTSGHVSRRASWPTWLLFVCCCWCWLWWWISGRLVVFVVFIDVVVVVVDRRFMWTYVWLCVCVCVCVTKVCLFCVWFLVLCSYVYTFRAHKLPERVVYQCLRSNSSKHVDRPATVAW